MKKKYIVTLTDDERKTLRQMLSTGKSAARKLMHARILLKADRIPGGREADDTTIADEVEASRCTVERVRKQFVEEGFDATLERRATSRQYLRKLDGDSEAHLIALTCQQAPEGRSRWTLRLLADRMVALEEVAVDSLSYETVRQVLKKTKLNLG